MAIADLNVQYLDLQYQKLKYQYLNMQISYISIQHTAYYIIYICKTYRNRGGGSWFGFPYGSAPRQKFVTPIARDIYKF